MNLNNFTNFTNLELETLFEEYNYSMQSNFLAEDIALTYGGSKYSLPMTCNFSTKISQFDDPNGNTRETKGDFQVNFNLKENGMLDLSFNGKNGYGQTGDNSNPKAVFTGVINAVYGLLDKFKEQ